MKIRMKEVDGIRCPHFVCEKCDELVSVGDPRPVVMTKVKGTDGDEWPVFHSWCDPRTPGHRALADFVRDIGFNSLGLMYSGGSVSSL